MLEMFHGSTRVLEKYSWIDSSVVKSSAGSSVWQNPRGTTRDPRLAELRKPADLPEVLASSPGLVSLC